MLVPRQSTVPSPAKYLQECWPCRFADVYHDCTAVSDNQYTLEFQAVSLNPSRLPTLSHLRNVKRLAGQCQDTAMCQYTTPLLSLLSHFPPISKAQVQQKKPWEKEQSHCTIRRGGSAECLLQLWRQEPTWGGWRILGTHRGTCLACFTECNFIWTTASVTYYLSLETQFLKMTDEECHTLENSFFLLVAQCLLSWRGKTIQMNHLCTSVSSIVPLSVPFDLFCFSVRVIKKAL